MGPLNLALNSDSFPSASSSSSDACGKKFLNLPMVKLKAFASVSMQDDRPFDFLRTLFEGVIAGGTAGVVVKTALYPIDTIKTRLQAGSSWWRENSLEGFILDWPEILLVYYRMASAIFVGVYEPTKQKLLKMFPENLSALAHFTAGACGGIAASLIRVPTEVVKQRMQTGQFTSASAAVRLIAAKEGFKGLYAVGIWIIFIARFAI
ncbi:hypothetical protein ACLB2K_007727 [Fragaria x ananassa]